MKFNRDTFLICAFLAASVMCFAAFRLAFPPADAKFALAPESERYAYKIPVNAASQFELKAFFGLTARKAAAIVKERGIAPFKSADDLGRVEQLSEKDRERIAPYLTYEEGKR